MRPYLAIIFDSLREALASRVLWVLVVGISLVLISLAPLGYRGELERLVGPTRQVARDPRFTVTVRRWPSFR